MVWIVTFLRVLAGEPIGEWELYWAMHILIGDWREGMARLLRCSAGRLRQLSVFIAILKLINFLTELEREKLNSKKDLRLTFWRMRRSSQYLGLWGPVEPRRSIYYLACCELLFFFTP